MVLAIFLDVYYLVVFVLPENGEGWLAQVRVKVVRLCEPSTQMALLLKGDFWKAVEEEEQREERGMWLLRKCCTLSPSSTLLYCYSFVTPLYCDFFGSLLTCSSFVVVCTSSLRCSVVYRR